MTKVQDQHIKVWIDGYYIGIYQRSESYRLVNDLIARGFVNETEIIMWGKSDFENSNDICYVLYVMYNEGMCGYVEVQGIEKE